MALRKAAASCFLLAAQHVSAQRGEDAPAGTAEATQRSYLVAVLCTAFAYFMNFEANAKAVDPNNHPAEDEKLGIDANRKREYAQRIQAQGGVDRWTRIAANQGENFPFHLWVFWSALMCGAATTTAATTITNASNIFVVYMGFRFLWVVCYVYALQPWRTGVFLCSQVCVLAAGWEGLGAAELSEVEEGKHFRLAAMLITIFFFILNFVARFKSIDPNNHPAEDAALGISDEKKREHKEAKQRDGPSRWERIAANQAETIPVSFTVYWAAYGVGANPDTCMYCFVAYAVLRILFVFFYTFSLQPFRSLSWAFGMLLTVGTAAMGIVKTLSPFNPCLCIMMVSTFICTFLNGTAVFRAVDPNNHPPEDAVLGVDDERKLAYAQRLEEQGGVDRWTRVAANQLENFPLHLVVFWGVASITGHPNTVSYFIAAYAASRLLFVVCYMNALTPWRSLTFLSSQLCVFGALTHAVWRASHALDVEGGPWMPLRA